ncbi:MAG: hypothetical protein H6598_09785 [Flavobacteriales bacterium]|nr:hypothetical protein [Flavobacteriales bacterium]
MKKTLISLMLSQIVIVATSQTLFMAVTKSGNNGYILKSEDYGKTLTTVWDSEMQASSGQNRLFDICYGDGKLVAVGNTILTSNDQGNTWAENNVYQYTGDIAFLNKNSMKCIAYGNGYFVAAGAFHIIYSKDGINWKFVRTGELTKAEQDAKKKPSGLSLEDIKKDPKLASVRPSIGEFPPEITPGLQYPLDILFADGKFYLVGGNRSMDGKVLKLEDDKIVVEREIGFEGNATALTTGGVKCIAWDGKSTLLACTNSTKSAYSKDMGKTWNYFFNPGKNQVWGVAYNDGTWTSVSPFADVFTSKDLVNWETSTRDGGSAPLNDMVFANGRYILVGNNGAVFSSLDGLKWERTSETLYGMHIQGVCSMTGSDAGGEQGQIDNNSNNEYFSKYNLINIAFETNYTLKVFSEGLTSLEESNENEIQLINKLGPKKIILSDRKLSEQYLAKNSHEKIVSDVVATFKKSSAEGEFKSDPCTINGYNGYKVSIKTTSGTYMTAFTSVIGKKLVILNCVGMTHEESDLVINSLNVNL